MKLVIGDKAYSSWSLRPWLAAKRAKLPFEEIQVRLRQPDTANNISQYSPSGKLPVLLHDNLTIWDSLAICEYLAELAPDAQLLPKDRATRAQCRSICAEMHAGFQALRTEFPMDIHARIDGKVPSAAARADISRVTQIMGENHPARGTQRPFLFGDFSVADAMLAPVATRFRTYGINLVQYGDNGRAAAYCETLLATPEIEEWDRDAALS